LLRLPIGWDGSWHPTPVRQLIVCLAGQFEMTVGDGRSRRFGPGEMILLEDTHGQGHVTKVVGSRDVECLSVQL
jgi:quercetin dioxygenase-like cupin family protein